MRAPCDLGLVLPAHYAISRQVHVHRFKYRFIKRDLVTVEKFCSHFSHVLGRVVDCINVNPSVRGMSNAERVRSNKSRQRP